jgi:LacI family transcriptional regulator
MQNKNHDIKQNNESRRNRPTLRTIAERVDLSPTAVSLALRGDNSIPLETRQRVLEAAGELEYEYVPRSRKSKQKRLRRLAFVIHDYGDHPVTTNPFYGHVLSGVEQTCREQHASLNFVVLQHEYPQTSALPPVLTHDLDGILLVSPYPKDFIHRISRESGCPVVLLDNLFPQSPYDSVMADDFGGAYQATQHLLVLGHRQILPLTGTIQHPTIIPSFRRRYWGYCAACSEVGVVPLPPVEFPANLNRELLALTDHHQGVQRWFTKLLDSYSPRPTAFFGVCDVFALAALRALQDAGWHIPEDYSVVGFDDYDISRMGTPALTTVHSYKRAMAWAAVERLLARIEGDKMPARYVNLETKLIVRESSGAPPKNT